MSQAHAAAAEDGELYGVVAEFGSPEELLEAAAKTKEAGYRDFETYSPFPIHGMEEATGQKYTRMPWIVFCAAVIGACVGFGLQTWTSAFDYPINIGGRPLISWPAFIPVTFECTILFAGISTVLSLFALNGLPAPYHPIFNTPGFERATVDRFFLCIEVADPKFNLDSTSSFLEKLGGHAVSPISR